MSFIFTVCVVALHRKWPNKIFLLVIVKTIFFFWPHETNIWAVLETHWRSGKTPSCRRKPAVFRISSPPDLSPSSCSISRYVVQRTVPRQFSSLDWQYFPHTCQSDWQPVGLYLLLSLLFPAATSLTFMQCFMLFANVLMLPSLDSRAATASH